MKDNKLHTPAGVRDFLTEFCMSKLETQQKISSLFHSFGFLPVETPTIEYPEVFEGKGSVNPQQMFRVTDRDGELLVLRSDLTPPVVRVAITAFSEKELPLRFSYAGNVFRNNESDQGKLREYTQTGIELMGVNSRDADAEVLAVAVHSLLTAGLTDFRIDIGQVQFFEGLTDEMKEAGLDDVTCKLMQDMIIHGDFVTLLQLAEDKRLPSGVRMILRELPALIGGKEIIQRAGALTENSKAKAALEDLLEIHAILEDYGLARYIKFDLSILGHLDYYSGFIFRGYTHGLGFSLLEGGRYDKLMSKFGTECPSVGFSIKMHDLLCALQYRGNNPPLQSVGILIAYTKEGRGRAIAAASKFRCQGIHVENSLLGHDIQANLDYARHKKMRVLLYFDGGERVHCIDLLSGERTEAAFEDIMQRSVDVCVI